MLAIINAELVMKDHLIPEAVLFAENGQIAGFGEMRNTPVPEDCEIVDAEGLYVGPGFVDECADAKTVITLSVGQAPMKETVPGEGYRVESGPGPSRWTTIMPAMTKTVRCVWMTIPWAAGSMCPCLA